MQLLDLIEPVIQAMGYELVDIERENRGLLRVLIDLQDCNLHSADQGVTLNDCERVSVHLNHFLTVENVAYERLEVSSPGLDRPLRKFADYVRFSGMCVSLKLRLPLNGRKNYIGILRVPQKQVKHHEMILEFENEKGISSLEFTLADVERARLVPVIDFKRNRK